MLLHEIELEYQKGSFIVAFRLLAEATLSKYIVIEKLSIQGIDGRNAVTEFEKNDLENRVGLIFLALAFSQSSDITNKTEKKTRFFLDLGK